MSTINIVFIAIAISIDAMVAAAAIGASEKTLKPTKAIMISLLFGFFQSFMPLIGWMIGVRLEKYIYSIDHWIAFSLLTILGIKIIVDSIRKTKKNPADTFNWKILLLLAIATSIDALIVGISFAFLPVNILMSISTIGITTLSLCFGSIYIGKKCGEHWGKKAEIFGGLI